MEVDKAKKYAAFGNFQPTISSDVDGRFPVVIYESNVTHLRVAVLQVGGPIVNGFITLATEANDDDGLPHTLEHLVFMGSEKYPWKGVLDLLANRCLASGTNAWTDVDHTCYTINTAGSEGFRNLLPIYLDHILYPTLTDTAFITEIHHINGEGEDAGIVYSEMQDCENVGGTIIHREMLRCLYPPESGYGFEFGGMLKNLRESTTNEKVRNFHKKFYRPENVWVIVTGQVDPLDILKAVEPIEQKIIEKGLDGTPYERPWMNPLSPLSENIHKDLQYPADEVDNGLVSVGWRGPSAIAEQKKMTAVSVLLDYLTDTAISPLQKAFVEIDSPLASKVSSRIIENAVSSIIVSFNDVPVSKLTLISEKLWGVLRDINEETLDMSRMRTILRKKIIDTWATLESDPHSALAYDIIGFMLYGHTAEDLTYRLNEDKYIEELMSKDASFWVGLLREYLDESKPHIVIRAKPSTEAKESLSKEEKARFQKRREEFGEAGLKEKKEIVDNAVEANEEEPDDEILTSVPVPSTDGIHFHHIRPYSNFALPSKNGALEIKAQSPHFNLAAIPIRMRIDDVNSNFVHLHLIIDTTQLEPDLRLFLPLYLEAITECPLKYPPGIRWAGKDGPGLTEDSEGQQVVPYELVVAQIEADTQSIGAYLGVSGGGVFSAGYYSNYAVMCLQVEIGKYADGIRWLRDLLYFPHFDPVRVQVVASKLAQSVAQKKKKGGKIAKLLITDMDFVKGSNHWAVSMIRQQQVLNDLSQELSKLEGNAGDSSKALNSLKALQRYFMESVSGMTLHMAADLNRLHEKLGKIPLEKPWLDTLLPGIEQFAVVAKPVDMNEPPSVVSDASLLAQLPVRMVAGSSDGVDPKHACAVGMGSVDSGYLIVTLQTDITSYTHPDCAPLMLFLQYLQQAEGPIWKAVRGQGLAYHYYMKVTPEDGLLTFCLAMASQVAEAYRVSEALVREHIAEDFEFDEELFESAKSSLIFEIIEKEQSITDLVDQSVLASFRGIPVDYAKTMIDRIWKVEEEEIIDVGKKYMTPLFDSTKSRCAVVCHSEKLSETVDTLKKSGRPLHPFDSVDNSFLTEL